jgi:DnaJ-class molecular chaperone
MKCPYCNGTGHTAPYGGLVYPCPKCHGEKVITQRVELVVTISNDDTQVLDISRLNAEEDEQADVNRD